MENNAKSITPTTKKLLGLRNHPNLPFTCDSCQEILLLLIGHHTDRGTDSHMQPRILGDIPTIKMKRECIVCQAVLGILLPESEIDDLTKRSTPENAEQVTFELRIVDYSPWNMWVRLKEKGARSCRAFLYDNLDNRYGTIVAFEEDEVNYAGVHSKVYDNPIDPRLYSTWIQGCTNVHKEGQDVPHSFDSRGLYLTYDTNESNKSLDLIAIDVVDECLVKITTNHRYVALSYVWGGVTGLQLLVSNRSELKTPGRLSLKMSSGEIPPAIRSAMILVQRIDERYLWVDRLCIEQDNQTSKHFNISNMGLIYSQALITLVDLSSPDATKPISGILGSSRIPVNKTWTFESPLENTDGSDETRSISLVTYPAELELILERSAYEKRAWTFQERLLSQRCLFFTDHAAYFHCKHGVFHCDADHVLPEDLQVQGNEISALPPMLDPLKLKSPPLARLTSWQLTLVAYTILVHQYSQRKLSFVTDKLNAFAGILATLMGSLPGSTAGGLPESLIDSCLLWNDVYSPSCPLERNRDFPSWSWASSNRPTSYYHGPLYLYDFSFASFSNGDCHLELNLVSKLENVGTTFETSVRSIVRIQSNSEHIQPGMEQYTRLGKDILHFDAEVCSIAHFRIRLGDQKVGFAEIRTHPEERPCGLLYPCSWTINPDSSKFMHKCDLVLLSTVKCHLCMGPGAKYWVGTFLKIFMKQDYCSQFDCTLRHAMIIEWHEDRRWAERVGIATIQGKAWERCERRRMRITLK